MKTLTVTPTPLVAAAPATASASAGELPAHVARTCADLDLLIGMMQRTRTDLVRMFAATESTSTPTGAPDSSPATTTATAASTPTPEPRRTGVRRSAPAPRRAAKDPEFTERCIAAIRGFGETFTTEQLREAVDATAEKTGNWLMHRVGLGWLARTGVRATWRVTKDFPRWTPEELLAKAHAPAAPDAAPHHD